MSDTDFPKTTLKLIMDTLIAGFDGYEVAGLILSSDRKPDGINTISDVRLPFLLFETGNIISTPWQFWQDSISWDIPAILKVKGEPGEVDDLMLQVLQALMQRTAELIGLPINADGEVVPFTPKTANLFDRGELKFVAERGAPFLKAVNVPPASGSYATASLIFHVESTIDNDPRGALPLALQARFGVVPMSGSLAADPTLPDPAGIPITPDSAFLGVGPYTTPDPLTKIRHPPLKQFAGVADADRVTAVRITTAAGAYAASLSSGSPTVQLSAIGQYANWNTAHVELLGSWVSSSPSVATVSASGLVTRVSAGTTSVTNTFGGVVSNAVAITCT